MTSVNDDKTLSGAATGAPVKKESTQSVVVNDSSVVGVTPQFLEQQERLEISGHIINSLINNKPGKKLNLAQMQLEANENYHLSVLRGNEPTTGKSSKVFREAEV